MILLINSAGDGVELPSAHFETNHVTIIEFKLSTSDWNELRYQHREAEFFPEEGKTQPEDPYTWFPAEVIIDGVRFDRAEVRKKGYIGSNDTRRPALKVWFFQSSEENKAVKR